MTISEGSPVGRNDRLCGSLESFQDAVGYRGGFDGRSDVVGADDVGASEDGGYVRGGGGVEAILH